MTTKFRILGYEALNKVAMTKAFREHLGFDIEDSKRMTDRLLKDGILEFEVRDSDDADELLKKLKVSNANVSTE